MQKDGRYLLVTNAGSLSPDRMLELYRAKDGVEKRFTVFKQDLRSKGNRKAPATLQPSSHFARVSRRSTTTTTTRIPLQCYNTTLT